MRVIAATNRDLAADVQRGTFRADLYFRLNIFPIRLPPLRDRRDDIPLLAQHFLREFAPRLGRQVDRFDARALDRLVHYDWPGNVRELANILERAVILCQGRVLQADHTSACRHTARRSRTTWSRSKRPNDGISGKRSNKRAACSRVRRVPPRSLAS